MSDAPAVSAAGAYAGIRQRINELVGDVSDRTGDTVPACPQWRVCDLVAHVAGVVDDVLGGRLEGAGSDPWTAAHVESRRSRSFGDILADWNAQAAQLEGVLDSFGPAGHQLVMDAVTHEHDLRGALGSAEARDSDAVRIGLDWLVQAFHGAAAANGKPGVRIVASDTGRSWEPSDHAPAAASVTAPSFELLRALSGRRTEAEIRSLSWDGDVDAVLPSLTWGPFRVPTSSLGE
ncbi:MAG TPA: maleylpyruvate isomerase family mycothiol-dependent enzyme [Acidimicrobiales bacterium]|nr:maleylpyruvate isomerase family mycothiol-dependent enzyme [Acidimicrobiales bacterium]